MLAVLAMASVLAGCPVPPRGGEPPVRPQPTGCAPGVRPIGVLAVVSDVVFRNNRRAANGERVCDGDRITTSPSGVGVVLPDGDRESDSVHIAENTDPRFTWTQGGCLSVDGYGNGRVIATARKRCMVVRTDDTLMLLTTGRVQFQVGRGISTQVVPVRGSYTKLHYLTPQEVATLSQVQLIQRAAPAADQPQPQSLNEYRLYKLTKPPLRLPPAEIKRIDGSVFNRTLSAPDIR